VIISNTRIAIATASVALLLAVTAVALTALDVLYITKRQVSYCNLDQYTCTRSRGVTTDHIEAYNEWQLRGFGRKISTEVAPDWLKKYLVIDCESINIYRVGWPLVFLEGYSADGKIRGEIKGKDAIVSVHVGNKPDPLFIPTHILWTPVIWILGAISAFSSIVVVLCAHTLRCRRRRRGCCCVCGYSKQSLTRCPECGTLDKIAIAASLHPAGSKAKTVR
jgi:hypothetical protein